MDLHAHVSVTGMGAVTALGIGLPALRDGLRAGRSGISAPAQPELCDLPAAAEIEPFVLADELRKLGASSEALLERARRCSVRAPFGLEAAILCVAEAWQDAGLHDRPVCAERIGIVVAGSNFNLRYQREMERRHRASPASLDPRYAIRFMDSDLVGVVSELFGIRGEGFSVGGASASGNVALVQASRLLRAGELDVCLVLGPVSDLSRVELQALRNLGALSGGGRRPAAEVCRPFDRARDGLVLGQGAGCMVLERRDSAERRAARAHAELAGGAVVLSADHSPAPDLDGEVRAMQRALAQARLEPEQVAYVNAHATSSVAGDEVEVQALQRVFGRAIADVWVNSSKGLLGHCLFSAGVVESIATVVQLREGFAHPNLNLRDPLDARCRLCGPEAVKAPLGVALKNSFGFGGLNTSLVIRAVGSA